MNQLPHRNSRAWSVLELLIVVAIFGVLASMAVPAFNSIQTGAAIRSAGDRVVGLLSLARQKAITENRPAELHLMQLQGDDSGDSEFRGIQVFMRDPDGQLEAATRFAELPVGAVVDPNEEFSSLLRSNAMAGVANPDPVPGRTVTGVRSIVFFPDGSTALPDHAGNYFLTIRHRNAAPADGAPADNFISIQVDPANGSTRVFQP